MSQTTKLCIICRNIDFDKFFNIPIRDCHQEHLEEALPNHTITYGTYEEVVTRSTSCEVCAFFIDAWLSLNNRTNRQDLPKPEEIFVLRRWLPRNGITGWNDHVGISMRAMSAGCARFEKKDHDSGPGIAFDPKPLSRYETNGRFRTIDPETINSGRADFRLIRKWLDTCEKHHSQLCKRCTVESSEKHPLGKLTDLVGFNSTKLRLIDVDSQEISLVDINRKYAALSYVWNQAGYVESPPRWIEREGRLYLPSNIPQTIKDALKVVQRLGQRYLWVDAYCINQEDDDELLRVINSIDVIFEQAYFTICAAGQVNGPPGLHGVSLPIERPEQIVKDCGIGVFKTISLPRMTELSRSLWNRRAWTMEEAVLSRRCLLLQPTRTVLWCNSSVYMEFAECPANAKVVWGVMASSLPFIFHIPSPNSSWDFEIWNQILDTFTSRHLTHETDAVRALAGLRNRVSKATNTPIPFGLPLSQSVCSLLWKTIANRECSRRTGFPSWSWTGWKCPAMFDHWLNPMKSAGNIYEFMLPTSGLSVWGTRNPETFGYRSVELYSEAKITSAPTQDLSTRKGFLNPKDYQLQLRSESAKFEVRLTNYKHISPNEKGSQLWRLYNINGTPVGLIKGHNILGEHRLYLVLPREMPNFVPHQLEFILIQHWKEVAPLNQRYGDVVTVIAVTRDPIDRTATRVGSFAVPFRDWKSANPQEVDVTIV